MFPLKALTFTTAFYKNKSGEFFLEIFLVKLIKTWFKCCCLGPIA